MSFDECMQELSEIVRNKEKYSISERMKAIGILIDLKNNELKKQNDSSNKEDNFLNITIDYGDDYESNSKA